MEIDEDMQFWRLADSLTLTQAALLIVGINPGKCKIYNARDIENSTIRNEDNINLPAAQFRAVYHSIVAAGRAERLKVTWLYVGDFKEHLDEPNSVVDVEDLKAWLLMRGFQYNFFFPEADLHEFKDPKHPRYASKLAAIVAAWEAVTEAERNKTVKQTLVKWLNKEAAKYGLLDDNNEPRKKIIEDLASIANWEPTGGAPKTAASITLTEEKGKKENQNSTLADFDLDSEVPF